MLDLVLSLHDVAPIHQERLERAERVFEDLGIRKVTYLLVPNFHGTGDCDGDAEFRAWCHAARPFQLQWLLHGYTHREDVETAEATQIPVRSRIKSKALTAVEAEFLRLGVPEQRRRLQAGAECFRHILGTAPRGFVAPAWLYNDSLPALLREMGFLFHEDHRSIHDLVSGEAIRAPVITWATRTRSRRWTSQVGCPLLLRLWGDVPTLRIAVHPHDFDYPDTVRSIVAVCSRALERRVERFYDEILSRRQAALAMGRSTLRRR